MVVLPVVVVPAATVLVVLPCNNSSDDDELRLSTWTVRTGCAPGIPSSSSFTSSPFDDDMAVDAASYFKAFFYSCWPG